LPQPVTLVKDSFDESEQAEVSDSFKDLIVWQRAVQLSITVYRLTTSFPPSEQFGLTNQLRRAAVSVASNIAEGYGKSTRGEYVMFLGHARGSIGEIQTQLVIAKAVGLASEQSVEEVESLSNEVGRMLVVMVRKLKN
jgi:four helix bundle protein